MGAPAPNLEPRTGNRSTPPERRRHLKAEVGVSETARGIIAAAFEAGKKSYEQIAEEVLLATGEKIGRSSLGRAWREWRVKQRVREAREIALTQLAGLEKLPPEQLNQVIEQLLRTNAYESLAQAESGQIDPGKALRAITARDRLRLDERRLDLEQALHAVEEGRLALQRERLAFDRERAAQRSGTDLERALEFWQTVLDLAHAADSQAAGALMGVADRVIDGLKQKYAAA